MFLIPLKPDCSSESTVPPSLGVNVQVTFESSVFRLVIPLLVYLLPDFVGQKALCIHLSLTYINQRLMIKEEIHLFELAAARYGLVISPMLASLIPVENAESAFDAHRHDSYGLFLLRSGEMTLLVEEQVVNMQGSSLLLVQPGQVHQCVHLKEISGWILFFDGKNLDTKTRSVTEQSIQKIALFELSNSELLFADHLLLLIHEASEANMPGPFQTQMLHALINALFYQAANMHVLRISFTENPASRPAQIVQQFKDLIKLHFKSLKRPQAYADLMHLSVSHLNDTVKAFTGYSATHLLQQEVIGDARKQLRYTTKTIKEIAFNLGFADDKYFIRLFSKVVGQSPSAFRKNAKAVTSDTGESGM
jgi:AraC-like DNA-binding protein